MKSYPSKTYNDHLNLLTEQSREIASDYGVFVNDSRKYPHDDKNFPTITFLLDFVSRSYPILGGNIETVMGQPKEAFLEGGLDFTLHNYKDFELLNQQLFPDESKTLSGLSAGDISQFRFSKSYRFKDRNGANRTILQRNRFICDEKQNLPIGIFGFSSDITHFAEQGKLVHVIEKYDAENDDWKCILSKNYYPDVNPDNLLSKREIEILKWSVSGMGSKQIADKLFISLNTVSTHRRNMLQKTNCRNSMELLWYAVENRLL